MANEVFKKKLLTVLLRAADRKVRPKIPSKQLRQGLTKTVESGSKGYLEIPHYWALYVHEGRNAPVHAQNSTFLIWYRDPRQDPRLVGGKTPKRASQLRRLTSSQFKDALQRNRDAREAGLEPPVVIVRAVRKSTEGVPFFSNESRRGMQGFVDEANDIGADVVREFALEFLKKELDVKGSLKIRL